MTTEAFTVRAESKIMSYIDKICSRSERSRNYIVNKALEAYVLQEKEFIRDIKIGLKQAKSGEGIEHEEFFEEFYARHNIMP